MSIKDTDKFNIGCSALIALFFFFALFTNGCDFRTEAEKASDCHRDYASKKEFFEDLDLDGLEEDVLAQNEEEYQMCLRWARLPYVHWPTELYDLWEWVKGE